MELSSMLSNDRFTDHPRHVCPVLAAFLRGYNDALPDRLRGDLFAVAADVVGTRTIDSETRERRAEALQDWAVEAWSMRRLRAPWPPVFPPDNAFGQMEQVGWHLGRVARRDARTHAGTLRVIRELAAEQTGAAPLPAPVEQPAPVG
jgi:hypothetical protein